MKSIKHKIMATKYFLFYLLLFYLLDTQAQAPKKFDYQIIVSNSKGEYLSNQAINARITILQSDTKTNERLPLFTETHATKSNEFGLVKLEIGKGKVVTGNFLAIDWLKDTNYIKTEIDFKGNGSYSLISTKELVDAPFVLYANNGLPYTKPNNFTHGKNLRNCNGVLDWECQAKYYVNCKGITYEKLINLTVPVEVGPWDMDKEYIYYPAYGNIPVNLIEEGIVYEQNFSINNVNVFIPKQDLYRGKKEFISIELTGPPIKGSFTIPLKLGTQTCELKFKLG